MKVIENGYITHEFGKRYAIFSQGIEDDDEVQFKASLLAILSIIADNGIELNLNEALL